MDWFASGLPCEGKSLGRPRAGDLARRDVPTCAPAERVGEVADRVRASGWDLCVVVDGERVVLGLLAGEALGSAGLAEQAMREAPTTLRPHVALDEAWNGLERRDGGALVITTSSGRLIGVLRRADLERQVTEASHAEATTR
jgi:CBS domain-containing protein